MIAFIFEFKSIFFVHFKRYFLEIIILFVVSQN
jgi:hypothetical protein